MGSVNTLDTDVLICGAGPAGSATALWLSRAGLRVVLADRAAFPREKTCGDGLSQRAVAELRRIGLDEWATDHNALRGVHLRGFGTEHDIAWPASRFGTIGAAVPRKELDEKLLKTAASAGATVMERVTVRLSAPPGYDEHGRPNPATSDPIELRDASGSVHEVRTRFLVGADGARSSLGRALGRSWQRDLPYGNAARCYVRSDRHDEAWVHTDVELRDASGNLQPGYGWVFPLGNGAVNIGVGTLSTEAHPARVAAQELLQTYVERMRAEWRLEGEPRAMSSGPLPLGGAVSGVAGPDWALTGDAAALVNPLNGDGLSYALQAGRLLAGLIATQAANPPADGSGLTDAWPRLLRSEFGAAFAVARRFANVFHTPGTLERIAPLAMSSSRFMTTAVRVMGDDATRDDADLVAALWRAWGVLTKQTDVPLGRPLFG